MSVAEFIELIVMTRDAVGGHVSNYVAVLFAYMIMVYLVADKLTMAQLAGITVLYSVYQFLPANATTTDIYMLGELHRDFRELHPEEAGRYLSVGGTYPLIFGFIAFSGWLLSVVYAVQKFRERDRVDT